MKPAAARRTLRRITRLRNARARSMCARITSTGTPPRGADDTRHAISGNSCSSRFDMVISSSRSDAPGGPRRRAQRLGARDADVAQHLITELHERATLARPVVPGQQRFDDPHEGVPHRGPEAGPRRRDEASRGGCAMPRWSRARRRRIPFGQLVQNVPCPCHPCHSRPGITCWYRHLRRLAALMSGQVASTISCARTWISCSVSAARPARALTLRAWCDGQRQRPRGHAERAPAP